MDNSAFLSELARKIHLHPCCRVALRRHWPAPHYHRTVLDIEEDAQQQQQANRSAHIRVFNPYETFSLRPKPRSRRRKGSVHASGDVKEDHEHGISNEQQQQQQQDVSRFTHWSSAEPSALPSKLHSSIGSGGQGDSTPNGQSTELANISAGHGAFSVTLSPLAEAREVLTLLPPGYGTAPTTAATSAAGSSLIAYEESEAGAPVPIHLAEPSSRRPSSPASPSPSQRPIEAEGKRRPSHHRSVSPLPHEASRLTCGEPTVMPASAENTVSGTVGWEEVVTKASPTSDAAVPAGTTTTSPPHQNMMSSTHSPPSTSKPLLGVAVPAAPRGGCGGGNDSKARDAVTSGHRHHPAGSSSGSEALLRGGAAAQEGDDEKGREGGPCVRDPFNIRLPHGQPIRTASSPGGNAHRPVRVTVRWSGCSQRRRRFYERYASAMAGSVTTPRDGGKGDEERWRCASAGDDNDLCAPSHLFTPHDAPATSCPVSWCGRDTSSALQGCTTCSAASRSPLSGVISDTHTAALVHRARSEDAPTLLQNQQRCFTEREGMGCAPQLMASSADGKRLRCASACGNRVTSQYATSAYANGDAEEKAVAAGHSVARNATNADSPAASISDSKDSVWGEPVGLLDRRPASACCPEWHSSSLVIVRSAPLEKTYSAAVPSGLGEPGCLTHSGACALSMRNSQSVHGPSGGAVGAPKQLRVTYVTANTSSNALSQPPSGHPAPIAIDRPSRVMQAPSVARKDFIASPSRSSTPYSPASSVQLQASGHPNASPHGSPRGKANLSHPHLVFMGGDPHLADTAVATQTEPRSRSPPHHRTTTVSPARGEARAGLSLFSVPLPSSYSMPAAVMSTRGGSHKSGGGGVDGAGPLMITGLAPTGSATGGPQASSALNVKTAIARRRRSSLLRQQQRQQEEKAMLPLEPQASPLFSSESPVHPTSITTDPKAATDSRLRVHQRRSSGSSTTDTVAFQPLTTHRSHPSLPSAAKEKGSWPPCRGPPPPSRSVGVSNPPFSTPCVSLPRDARLNSATLQSDTGQANRWRGDDTDKREVAGDTPHTSSDGGETAMSAPLNLIAAPPYPLSGPSRTAATPHLAYVAVPPQRELSRLSCASAPSFVSHLGLFTSLPILSNAEVPLASTLCSGTSPPLPVVCTHEEHNGTDIPHPNPTSSVFSSSAQLLSYPTAQLVGYSDDAGKERARQQPLLLHPRAEAVGEALRGSWANLQPYCYTASESTKWLEHNSFTTATATPSMTPMMQYTSGAGASWSYQGDRINGVRSEPATPLCMPPLRHPSGLVVRGDPAGLQESSVSCTSTPFPSGLLPPTSSPGTVGVGWQRGGRTPSHLRRGASLSSPSLVDPAPVTQVFCHYQRPEHQRRRRMLPPSAPSTHCPGMATRLAFDAYRAAVSRADVEEWTEGGEEERFYYYTTHQAPPSRGHAPSPVPYVGDAAGSSSAVLEPLLVVSLADYHPPHHRHNEVSTTALTRQDAGAEVARTGDSAPPLLHSIPHCCDDPYHRDEEALEMLSVKTTSSCAFGAGLDGLRWQSWMPTSPMEAGEAVLRRVEGTSASTPSSPSASRDPPHDSHGGGDAAASESPTTSSCVGRQPAKAAGILTETQTGHTATGSLPGTCKTVGGCTPWPSPPNETVDSTGMSGGASPSPGPDSATVAAPPTKRSPFLLTKWLTSKIHKHREKTRLKKVRSTTGKNPAPALVSTTADEQQPSLGCGGPGPTVCTTDTPAQPPSTATAREVSPYATSAGTGDSVERQRLAYLAAVYHTELTIYKRKQREADANQRSLSALLQQSRGKTITATAAAEDGGVRDNARRAAPFPLTSPSYRPPQLLRPLLQPTSASAVHVDPSGRRNGTPSDFEMHLSAGGTSCHSNWSGAQE